MKILPISALLLACTAVTANAQEQTPLTSETPAASTNAASDAGFYVGGSFGFIKSEITSLDDSDADGIEGGNSLKLLAGYKINRIVSVEASYVNYGEHKVPGAGGYAWKPTAINASANLGYTFDNGVRPFAYAGLGVLELNEEPISVFDDSSAGTFHFGLGVEFFPTPSKNFGLRLAWEGNAFNIDLGTEDETLEVSSLNLGVSYRF
ncbi:porin family protein [Paraferrimonas haliotis]|uniref:Membrane protein n=1 Tax=Paraferrimonas haliotis TaxID=2013866 RepID=A0AA37WYD0_9GAMM|nr:porin family protein [Paraferrimonas haliotis]GLS83690.1 membrane protein [Paraferrimonas haliotis]